jgi:glucosamine-6-phosphate deaminase
MKVGLKSAEKQIDVSIEEDYDQMSSVAAAYLVEEINKIIEVKDYVTVVPSTGGTPDKTYELLRTKYKNQVDWTKIVLFQMDDYVGLSPYHLQSFSYYLMTKLIKPLGIQDYHLLPNGLHNLAIDLEKYEETVNYHNGIDLVIHGVGTNGHLGFNEPGSSFNSKTRVVNLAQSTIHSNSRFFSSLKEVPRKGVTLGLDILSKAKKTLLLASGEQKQFAIKSLLFQPITEKMPASILQQCSDVKVILDRAACSWTRNSSSIYQANSVYKLRRSLIRNHYYLKEANERKAKAV